MRIADPTSKAPDSDYFIKREFTFNLPGEIYVRYLCFSNAEEFAKEVMRRQPDRIEIGPVYSMRPDKKHLAANGRFTADSRELIFDIDLNDYDDIRTCCTGATICKRCWSFINVAVKILDSTLRQDFGFQHILFVYSGRRGMHCWVSDESARELTNEQRSGIVEYINAKSGDSSASAGIGSGAANPAAPHIVQMSRVFNAMTVPLVPAFTRAFTDLEAVFVEKVCGEEGQCMLHAPQHWIKVLDCIPDVSIGSEWNEDGKELNLKQLLQDAWPAARNAEQRWGQLKATVNSMIKLLGGPTRRGEKAPKVNGKFPTAEVLATKQTLEKLLPALVITFCYPRLDVEVSKHRNHLLKAPFCIHPKTGRVCVPLTAAMADEFDPTKVPTVSQLMREGMEWTSQHPEAAQDDDMGGAGAGAGGASKPGLNAGGAKLDSTLWQQTSIRPYIEILEAYLKDLYASIRQSRREKAEAGAAMGDW